MKITVYGTNLCPETLHALNLLWGKLPDPTVLSFVNFTGSISLLKEFMAMRDTNPDFEATRARGGIGIPYFVLEDGTSTHDLQKVLSALGI